jgi:F-type H+-transporting ATPase subunit epsilon
MKELQVILLTPEVKTVLSGVSHLILECPDGKRGILPGHAPAVIELAIGVLEARFRGGEREYYAISGGVAEITPETVTILTETCEKGSEIDEFSTKRILENTRKEIREKRKDPETIRLETRLLFSLAKLKAKELSQKRS